MDKAVSKQIKECEFCNSNATCLCFKCNNYFCENCYKIIHQLEKYSNHKKDPIDPFVPIELKCPDHPEHPLFFFCLEEKGKFFIIN